MLERFFPDIIVDRVQDIDLELMKEKNIKAFLIDIDNTLVPQFMKESDKSTEEWLEKVRQAGFKVCIVSNASKRRVMRFCERLNVPAVYRASKPAGRAFRKALKLLGVRREEAAVVGDQIFTDVYGGNRAGMLTILVRPLDRREFFFVRFKRFPERFVLKSYQRHKDPGSRSK